jgi:hypothetical protein
MPFKQNTSSSLTASERVDQDGVIRQSISRSTTITRRKMTRGETAGGLLTTIGQINMIGITILTLAVGSAVNDFDITDLQATNPNYNNTNTYIPIIDPLDNVDYQQYGSEVFGRFFGPSGFITLLSSLGTTAQNIANCLTDLPKCFEQSIILGDEYRDNLDNPVSGSFIDTFGSERFLLLSLYASTQMGQYKTTYYIYTQMTTAEREFVRDATTFMTIEKALFLDYEPDYFLLFGFTDPYTNTYKWGYYKFPNIKQNIVLLGV